MIAKRIVPCLDVKDGRVVKGVNFQGLADVSSPVELARYYSACGADELVFYDITASAEGRALFTAILAETASTVFIPLTVGGGINTVEDFDRGETDGIGGLKIAVVGKPNAGKSSIVNRLLGEERTIVTPVAGTTRDAVDTTFERGGKQYTIIDTAGIRRKRSVEDDVEYYSVLRAFDAVRRADVAVLVVDSTEGLTEQDVRIIGFVHEEGKPSVVVMNKWDLVEKDTQDRKSVV